MSQSSSSVQDVLRSTTRSNLSRPPCFCIILLASSSPADACTWMSDHPGSFVESASVECMRISFQERPKSSSASPHIPGIPQISADDSCITSHVIINALTLCMFVKYVFFLQDARCLLVFCACSDALQDASVWLTPHELLACVATV